MNYNKADFMASYGISSQLPDSDRPEISFSGRSNVGKSSLINKLCSRKNLARVSATPGKTATINFYEVDSCYFVDLPGYGYARRGHEERRNWAALIQKYLEETRTLRALVLLIDCRIPTQESDRVMAQFATSHRLPVIPVLTKADKCSLKERSAQQKIWEGILGQKPVTVSAVTRLGLDELWKRLREAGTPDEQPSSPAENDAPSTD